MTSEGDNVINDMYNVTDNDKQREQALKEQGVKGSKMIWAYPGRKASKYPAALDDPKLATGDRMDVGRLGYPYRHIFQAKVAIEVFMTTGI